MSRRFDEQLMTEVDDALGRGEGHGAIVDRLALDFGVERRVVKRAIAVTLRRCAARVTDADPDEQRATLLGSYLSIYRETRRLKHHKTALAALDSIAKLLGLTPVLA